MKLQIFIALVCFTTSFFAQNIQRSSLGSSGDTSEISVGENNYYVSQSVGQNSVIGTFSSNNQTIRQGYQQPPIKVKINANLSNSLNVNVYPNPIDTYVTILFNEQLKTEVNIVMYDITGKVVYNKYQEPTSSFNIDMSFLSSGIYLINITAENKKFIAQLIKK